MVVFQTGGTEGSPGITFLYSLDGGYTWSQVTALPLNGVFVFPDGAGSTGITLTVGAGTISALDQVAANTTAPGYQFSDVQTAINTVRNWGGLWSFFVLTGYSSRAMRDSVENLLQTDAASGRYTWAFVSARNEITGEMTTSPSNVSGDLAWSGRLVAEWGTSVGNRTPPIAGSERITCPMTGRYNRRPVTAAYGPREIGITPDRDPGDRTLPQGGALSSDQSITSSSGALVEHDARLNPSLYEAGFCVLRTYYGEQGLQPGIYPAGGLLMSAATDIQYLCHRRTLNLADSALYAAMTDQLIARLGINPATMKAPYQPGDIQPWDVNNLRQALRDRGLHRRQQLREQPPRRRYRGDRRVDSRRHGRSGDRLRDDAAHLEGAAHQVRRLHRLRQPRLRGPHHRRHLRGPPCRSGACNRPGSRRRR